MRHTINRSPQHPLQCRSSPGIAVVCLLAAFVLTCSVCAFGQENTVGADLRIVGMLDVHPPLPEEGDTVQIGILVENRGTKDARDVPVYFYEDDVWFDKETLDVRAGDTIYLEVYWTADSGDSYLSAVIDPAGYLDEDAADNRVGAWVTVR